MTVGEKIKQLCDESNMKQAELAGAIGRTESSISRYCNSLKEPRVSTLKEIADYFDVSVDWLLGRSEHRNYNGYISGDDALEYCKHAERIAQKCWLKTVGYDLDIPSAKLAQHVISMAWFEHERSIWGYTVPNMIHSLVDGSWKNDIDDAMTVNDVMREEHK